MARNDFDPKTYIPTPQGLDILEAICKFGGLTRLQVSILLGYKLTYNKEGRLVTESHCKDLLHYLCLSGYLNTTKRPFVNRQGQKGFFHTITRKGKRVLASFKECAEAELECKTAEKGLEHFILVNDFQVTLLRSVRDFGEELKIVESDDEATLRVRHESASFSVKFKNSLLWPQDYELENVTVVPDYFFRLTKDSPERTSYRRFVEVDRGRETLKNWEVKMRKYREYMKSGGWCVQQYGTNAVAVLTVTESETRLENLKAVTEQIGAKGRFWFTTQDSLNAATFLTAEIWRVAGKKGRCRFFSNPQEMEDIAI